MIRRDLLEGLLAALRPAEAGRLLEYLTGPGAEDVRQHGAALARRPRLERAAALAEALRNILTGRASRGTR